MTPSRGTQLRSHQKWAQSPSALRTFFSSFSQNIRTPSTPTSASPRELAGRWKARLHPVTVAKPPGARTTALTASCPGAHTGDIHPMCSCSLPEPDSRKLYHCWVATYCQMEVSAASFWQRLNCYCYLSGKCISLGWRAFGKMALVQIGKRIQPNEGPQQGLSKQEGSCYHHPQELRGPFT